MTLTQRDNAIAFRKLHQGPGAFVIPNPWDASSARILAGLGFEALARVSEIMPPPSMRIKTPSYTQQDELPRIGITTGVKIEWPYSRKLLS